MKNKTIISIAMAVVLILTLSPASAASTDMKVIPIINDGRIASETIMVEGVPVTFTTYNRNGVISQSVSIGASASVSKAMTDDVKTRIGKSIEQIADRRAAQYSLHSKAEDGSSEQPKIQAQAYAAPSFSWTETKSNTAAGTGAGENSKVIAGHWSTLDYWIVDTAGQMKAYNGASRVVYSGYNTVTKMALIETITKKTLSIFVSYPFAFFVNEDNSSASLSHTWYGNNYLCTMYRNDMTAYSPFFVLGYVGITTDASVQIQNSSYQAVVRSSW